MPPKNPGDRSWKQALQEWMFAQSVPTVLLILICAFICYGLWKSQHYVEIAANAYNAARAADAESHRKEMAIVTAAYTADQERDERVQQRNEATIERQERIIDQLMDRLGQDVAAQGNSGRHNQSASVEP